MSRLLSAIFRWLLRQSLVLLLILGVFVAAAWVKGEIKRTDDLRRERAALVERIKRQTLEIEQLQRIAGAEAKKITAVIPTFEAELKSRRAERQLVWDAHPFKRNIPLSQPWVDIRLLDAEIRVAEEFLAKKAQFAAAYKQETAKLSAQWHRDTTDLHTRIADTDRLLRTAPVDRTLGFVREHLPVALLILLGVILTPIVIKLILYFVVAPIAAGRPPIRILPTAVGRARATTHGTADVGKMSAVSQPIVLGSTRELLVKPEFLQSTSLHSTKSTRWLLDRRFPFTSLLSGMTLLTQVRSTEVDPVVVSSTKDALTEVGILKLEEGAAFVCQPRSLAGVIQDIGRPVRITRHWRLGSMQAWLTLQLRFLVFHGPGQLVLKGCRGIRIEPAGNGRLINQAATLGFSANIDYANTRCETFLSYWTGKEDLFNDLFTGANGVYVYEEMPDLKRSTGITGRGLEGLSDGVLKVFGV